MNHDEAKQLFLSDPETKLEYEELEALYEVKRQIIQSRIEMNMSQKELAAKVGTGQSAISRLENGSYNPSLAFIGKVAKALGKQIHIRLI